MIRFVVATLRCFLRLRRLIESVIEVFDGLHMNNMERAAENAAEVPYQVGNGARWGEGRDPCTYIRS